MIEIVPAITEHNWHSCVILTFGTDLPFYEDVVLRELWGKGCRNNLVIVDNSRYGDTLQAERGAIKWIGQRYVCQPIAMASGLRAFHPKVIMLAGTTFGRLLIGSGNLGFRGYGRNWEAFTQFDIGPDEEDRGYAPLFISAVEMLDTLAKEYGFWPQSRRMIEKMRHLSPWLLQPGKIDSPAHVSLLHNLTSSLLSQLADQLQDHDVTEITVVSPFFDADCKTFITINRLFHPERIKVVIQQDTSDLQVKRLKQLAETEDMPIRTYLFDVPADRRYLHAKLTIFKTPDAAWCISGSANFTRPGMQLTAGEGNFEVAVLHHAESPDGFDVLLENKIAAVALSSDAIRARPPRPPMVGKLPDMRLLEAKMDARVLRIRYKLHELELVNTVTVRAYLSVMPPLILEHDGQLATEDTLEFTLSAEERNRVAGSTSVYCEISSPVRSQPIASNELWITDVEALKHAHRDPLFDEKVRKFLRDQEVNTAEEWNDLYTLLADIVSLDVVELRKRGGSYTTGPRRKSGRPRLGERVVLADEDPLDSSEEEDWAREMFHESALNVMLTNAVSRLPSVRRDQDRDISDGEEDGTGDSDADGDKSGRLRKPLPPNEKVRRRFIGLLRKYTRSLENAEFIATASLYHILGYYVIFQKMAFLLLLSGATGVEEYVDRIRAINHRFFGTPDDPPPVLMSTCQHYVSSTWAREWLEEGVVAFAVAGADFMVALARHEPALYQIREELRADRLRILASLGVVLNLPAYLETPLPGFDAALEMYRQWKGYYSDWVEISLKLERDFPQINQTLSTWQDQAYYRWAKTPHGLEKRQYQRALIDYGQSALSVEQYLGNEGEQIKWCTHLVPHLRNTDEFQRASELHDMSLKLLHDQKQGQELVEALYEQGKELFYAGAATEAEESWRQARCVAERLGDNPLLQKLDRNITWAKVMASIERAARGATSADAA